MASLRKRKGTAVWQAQFYVKDPETGDLRQVRRSTGQTNRKKAMAVAVDMERNAQGVMAAGSERAQRAKAILAEACAEIDRETFTQTSARKYLRELVMLATGEEMQTFTVETWIAEWVRRKARKTGESTMKRYRGHTDNFMNWLGDERANKPLESITTQDAQMWVDSILDTGVVGKTALGYAKDLGSVYRLAVREGLVTFNPFTALESIDTSDSHERKPFTTDEVVALMKAAPTWEWRGLILVGAFTGLRLSDGAQLRWDVIDLDGELISLVPSKTRKKKRMVRIPLQPDLLTFLKEARRRGGPGQTVVFSSLSKLPVNSRNGLSLEFVRIMSPAGVDRGKPSRVLAEGETTGAGRITYPGNATSFGRRGWSWWPRRSG